MNTVSQKALLSVAQSLAIGVVTAVLVAIYPLLIASGPINWKLVLLAAIPAVIASLGHNFASYLKAYNPQLAMIVDADVQAIETKFTPPQGGSVIAATTTVVASPLQGNEEVKA